VAGGGVFESGDGDGLRDDELVPPPPEGSTWREPS